MKARIKETGEIVDTEDCMPWYWTLLTEHIS